MAALVKHREKECDHPEALTPPPISLDQYEAVDSATLLEWLRITHGSSQNRILYLAEAVKWWKERHHSDHAMHIVSALLLYLTPPPPSPSSPPVEEFRLYQDMWELVVPHMKSIRMPQLCKVFQIITFFFNNNNNNNNNESRLSSSQSSSSILNLLCERVCIHIRQITDPEDIFHMITCLNRTNHNHPRLLAHLEVKIKSFLNSFHVKHLPQILRSPIVRGDLAMEVGKRIRFSEVEWNDGIELVKVFADKKIPLPNEEIFTLIVSRINMCSTTSELIQLYDTIERFNIVSCITPKLARRITRKGLEINAFDSLETLQHHFKIIQHCSRELRLSTIPRGPVFLALAEVLSNHILSQPPTVAPMLLDVYFELGLPSTASMRGYVEAMTATRRASDFTPSECVHAASALQQWFDSESQEVRDGILKNLIEPINNNLLQFTSTQIVLILSSMETVPGCGMKYKHFISLLADRTAALGKTMPPHELSSCLKSLAALDCTTHRVFTTLRPQIDAITETSRTSEVVDLITIFSKVPVTENAAAIVAKLVTKAFGFSTTCLPSDAVNVLVAVSSRPIQNKRLIAPYTARVLDVAPSLKGREVLTVLTCFSKLTFTDAKVYSDLLKNALTKRQEFAESDVGDLVITCAKVSLSTPEVFQQLALRAIAFGPKLSVKTICNVMKGFAQVSAKNEELFLVISNRVVELREKFSNLQLMTLLESFGSIGASCHLICHNLLPTIGTQLSSASLKDTVSILKAFTTSSVFTHKFLQAIATRVLFYERHMTASLCTDTLYCFAKSKYTHEKLLNALVPLLPRIIRVLSPHNLVKILKVLDYFSDHRDMKLITEIVSKLQESPAVLSPEDLIEFNQLSKNLLEHTQQQSTKS